MTQPTRPTGSTEYFFNTRTGEVEEGRQSVADDLMGPYASPQDAAAAFEIARRRNEAADAAEREWEADED